MYFEYRDSNMITEKNGDRPVFASTGFEYCEVSEASTYDNVDIYIGC